MASPKAMLSKTTQPADSSIKELISRAFSTRNLLHFRHLSTPSYAAHNALGSLYDQIIEDIDSIAEAFQGKYGLLSDLSCKAATVPKDIVAHVEEEMNWVEENQNAICNNNSSISNMVDNLVGHYQSALYKLKNLS
jgi:hypothetical protein